ncbi:MAG: hypothetical protein WA817_02040 [Candidatus Acidiferrum sp.]
MNRSRHLVFLWCLSVCGGMVPGVATAQSTTAPGSAPSFRGTSTSQSKILSTSDEVTATGTIQEVVSTFAKEGPRGIHVILTGPQGVIDASVGPYLSTEVQQSLASGQSVTAQGVLTTVNGHDYMLVRQLSIGDRQITVRNQAGFLVHPANTHTRENGSTKGDNQ